MSKTPGQVAYEAYYARTLCADIPFHENTEASRAAWEAAARAVQGQGAEPDYEPPEHVTELVEDLRRFAVAYPESVFPKDGTSRDAISGTALRIVGGPWFTKAADCIEQQSAEIARLKRGDFTPDELQNLCHNLTTEDCKAFSDGCVAEQRKLFGCAPLADEIARLTARVAELEGMYSNNLAAEREAGWIKCSERLPNREGSFLVWAFGMDVQEGIYANHEWGSVEGVAITPTHWMPMQPPEPKP